jgi:hypothetical protein
MLLNALTIFFLVGGSLLLWLNIRRQRSWLRGREAPGHEGLQKITKNLRGVCGPRSPTEFCPPALLSRAFATATAALASTKPICCPEM